MCSSEAQLKITQAAHPTANILHHIMNHDDDDDDDGDDDDTDDDDDVDMNEYIAD